MVEETVWSEQNSNTFLSYYNEIDKLFTKLLELDKYVPFNERLAAVVAGNFPVSPFVRHVEDKLRYFGDLRNQLVHGFRLDHRHYLLVSDHAIQEIKHMREELQNPTSLVMIFGGDVVRCEETELLKTVLIRMRHTQKTHMPVYSSGGVFLGMLSESTITAWLTDVVMGGAIDIVDVADTKNQGVMDFLEHVSVDTLNLNTTNERYVFVPQSTSVYAVDALFTQERDYQQRLGAVCVTSTGSQDEEICCVITALDLPKANAYMKVSF